MTPPHSPNSEISALLARINQLEAMVRAQATQGRRESDPLPKIFLARTGSTSKQFQEQIVASGSIEDYADGRTCTSDSDPSALIDNGAAFPVLELPDFSGGLPVSRYVSLSTSKSVVGVITGAVTSASGLYYINTYGGAPTLDKTSPLSLPEGLTIDTSPAAMMFNPAESGEGNDLDGSSIHTLSAGAWSGLLLMGTYQGDEGDPDNGKKVYCWLGGDGLPAGGLKNDVLTKFSDGGPPVWAAARFQ